MESSRGQSFDCGEERRGKEHPGKIALGRFRIGETRWLDIQDGLRRMGIERDSAKCKSKWEKMMTDFKKVFDYDKDLGSGLLSYNAMTGSERKSRNLPKKIQKDFFDFLVSWVPDSCAVDPSGINVMDTGVPPAESNIVEGLASENQTPIYDMTDDKGSTVHTQSRRNRTQRENLDHNLKKNNEGSFLSWQMSLKERFGKLGPA
jgi:hypothetical protein